MDANRVIAMLGVMAILLCLTPDRPSAVQEPPEREDVEKHSIEKQEQ